MIAMMSVGDINQDFISIEEIKDYFYNSWVFGCKHMAYQINLNKAEYQSKSITVPSVRQFAQWASRFENSVKKAIEEDLVECGININQAIPLKEFSRWICRDHSIILRFEKRGFIIATTLNYLDEVGYDPGFTANTVNSQIMGNQPMVNDLNKNNPYPSF